MFHKLDEVVAKHREITEELQLPETSANPKRLTELNKQLASMDDIVQKYLEYKKLKDEYKLFFCTSHNLSKIFALDVSFKSSNWSKYVYQLFSTLPTISLP